jgi:CRISPR-associated protein Csd1
MCLITGEVGPIAATHDKIKGMANLGGQPAGVSLMSFDKEAFRSYGWEQNANSPVSPGRAMAYVLALNDLLRGDRRKRVNHNGIGFLFWTRKPVDYNSIETVEQADPEQVKRLLSMDRRQLDLEENEFYLAGVSGNGGRMQIRYWMHDTLGQVKSHMASYFRGVAIADVFSGETVYPKMYQLLDALGRERDDVPAQCAVQIIRRAIEGKPLGRMMLARALGRVRVESGRERLTPARAGLIKLFLNDLKGETQLSEKLDTTVSHPAYLCGRLLALYEYVQYAEQKDLNASVTDRYYSLASTHPALAFPKLADLGMKHLRKLRRDKPGLAVVLDRELQDIHALVAANEARFPGALSLESQGRFVIGYHHQRGKRRLQAKEDATVQSTEETN